MWKIVQGETTVNNVTHLQHVDDQLNLCYKLQPPTAVFEVTNHIKPNRQSRRSLDFYFCLCFLRTSPFSLFLLLLLLFCVQVQALITLFWLFPNNSWQMSLKRILIKKVVLKKCFECNLKIPSNQGLEKSCVPKSRVGQKGDIHNYVQQQ